MRSVLISATCSFFFIQCGPAQNDSAEREFNPRQVVPEIRPITDAPIAKPSKMRHSVAAGDLVLGVTVGKSARAYPINMLTGPMREIINDELGGRAIAATW